ncbi:LamG domain-containing protein [Kitasatospora sp. MAP5-34]|uniref:LamG domain-containing protein n=1 Tax=Kitasatospora sp. MAP5-34 TaxID=3035102 RepID=UPI00247405A8|nr:LamG domain-containing protein [Kitasatospora sp. MAP5-34]MDH6578718.1 hypothetical protein [Kitasatospora sp. MAP5-34]
MSSPSRSFRRRPGPPRLAAAVAFLGLTAALATPVAAHADSSPTAATIAARDAAHATLPPASEVDKAIAQAKSSGRNIPVPSLTTEYSETVATPAGHLQESRQVEAQRVKRNGVWAGLDATLAANADGTLSPKAASSDLTLSGGGSGPLATMTGSNGQQIAIAAPFALPKPTTSGNGALYPNVAPGVDLKVTATKGGGFSTVLIVKNAAAAANPAFKTLHWATTAKGVKLSADSKGNISALDDRTGKRVFSAPTPIMWDSSNAAEAPAAAPAGAPARTPRSTANRSATPPPAPDAVSSTSGPGANAKVAAMPTTADNNAVDLVPSQAILTDPGTRYPVYIDPSWLSDTPSLQNWAWVRSDDGPDTHHNGNTPNIDTNHLGVGLCGDYGAAGDSCIPQVAERVYYQFNVQAWHGALINNATLTINEYSTASWDCGGNDTVSAYVFSGIDDNTYWGNQPDGGTFQSSAQAGAAGQTGCYGNVPVPLNVTNAMTSAAAQSWNIMDIGIRGSESNQNALKYFNASPTLVVTYDRYPKVPSVPHTGPVEPRLVSVNNTVTTDESCDERSPSGYSWITGNSTQLQATVNSDAQGQLNIWAHIWDNAVPTSPDKSGWSSLVSNGSVASYQLPANYLQDGHFYGWEAFANDGIAYSAKTAVCHFAVDNSPPTVHLPGVNKTSDKVTVGGTYPQLPPSGNGQVTGISAGQVGYIPFSVTDTAPGAGLLASGVAAIRVSYAPNPAANWGWVAPDYVSGASGKPVSIATTGIPVKAAHWGTNTVYVQAKDRAGNQTQEIPYTFWVPWVPTPLAYGDVTGDGHPDVLAPDVNTGDLLDYNQAITFNAPSAGGPAPSCSAQVSLRFAACAANAPGTGHTWKDYRISHRGSTSPENPVDGLFAHIDPTPAAPSGGGGALWYIDNNPDVPGTFYGGSAGPTQLYRPDCAATAAAPKQCDDYGDIDSWATIRQITPIGSGKSQLSPSDKSGDATGILVVQQDNLWYYPAGSGSTPPNASGNPVKFGAPVELAKGGWNDYDLMIPGDTLATGHPALWVRANKGNGSTVASGDILQFALNFDAGNTVVTGITQSPTTRIGSGMTPQNWPLIGSDGDLTGDNVPDLWARAAGTNQITTWGGVAAVTGFDSNNKPVRGPVTGFTRRTNQWLLSGSTPTDDAGHASPVNPTGNVSWSTAPVTGTALPGSARLDGGILPTGNAAFNTGSTFSVSAWVKVDNFNSYQTFVSQSGANMGGFYLQYNKGLNAWAFLTTASDSTGAAQYIAHSDSSKLSTQWTHLVGTYDPGVGIGNGLLTLYVNGVAVGTANVPTTTWSAPGSLTIGGARTTTGAISNQTTGNIAGVATYPYTLSKEQVSTIFQNQ